MISGMNDMLGESNFAEPPNFMALSRTIKWLPWFQNLNFSVVVNYHRFLKHFDIIHHRTNVFSDSVVIFRRCAVENIVTVKFTGDAIL